MWMQLRRFTRFTNAFSGKLSHLKAVVATRVRGYLDGLQGILEFRQRSHRWQTKPDADIDKQKDRSPSTSRKCIENFDPWERPCDRIARKQKWCTRCPRFLGNDLLACNMDNGRQRPPSSQCPPPDKICDERAKGSLGQRRLCG